MQEYSSCHCNSLLLKPVFLKRGSQFETSLEIFHQLKLRFGRSGAHEVTTVAAVLVFKQKLWHMYGLVAKGVHQHQMHSVENVFLKLWESTGMP